LVQEHASNASDDRAMLGILLACVLGEDAVDDWSPVVQIAETLVGRDRLNPVYATGLGAALYNAGRVDEAVKTLTLAVPLQALASVAASHMSDQIEWSRSMSQIYLARAHNDLGNAAESRGARDLAWQSIVRMERSKPRYDSGVSLWGTQYAVYLSKRQLARFFDGYAGPEPQGEQSP
jgi:hypothetical protein